jgi:hypothetical protein
LEYTTVEGVCSIPYKARVLGGASDTELIEYDLRQEVIGEIQKRLALTPL